MLCKGSVSYLPCTFMGLPGRQPGKATKWAPTVFREPPESCIRVASETIGGSPASPQPAGSDRSIPKMGRWACRKPPKLDAIECALIQFNSSFVGLSSDWSWTLQRRRTLGGANGLTTAHARNPRFRSPQQRFVFENVGPRFIQGLRTLLGGHRNV